MTWVLPLDYAYHTKFTVYYQKNIFGTSIIMSTIDNKQKKKVSDWWFES